MVTIHDKHGDEIKRLYVDEKFSIQKVADTLGVGVKGVRLSLIKNNIKFRKKNGKDKTIQDQFGDEIKKMYVEDNMSTLQIGTILNISDSAVCKSLKKSKVTLRSYSEANQGLHQGENNPFYGKKHSKEYVDIIKKRAKYDNPMKRPEVSIKLTGKNNGMYGKKRPDLVKFNLENRVGSLNPNWKGGVSFEPYCSKFNKEFRRRVRLFWDNECGICGKPQKDNGKKLAVHHINYDKNTCCNTNIRLYIPLCTSCHSKTNFNRDYWEKMLTNYIMTYFNGECFIHK